ncbi:MAG: ABC transporter permease [Bacillota bacterium]
MSSKDNRRLFWGYYKYSLKAAHDIKKWKNFQLICGGLIILAFLVAAGLGAAEYKYQIFKYSPFTVNISNSDIPPSSKLLRSLLSSESLLEYEDTTAGNYLLGTDSSGRDIAACLIGGATTYLVAGSVCVLISLILGIFWGSMTGYYSNTLIASFNSFIVSVLESYPVIVLMILVLFIYNFSFWAFVIALGFVYGGKISHIVSNKVEILKNLNFIEAAKELGLPDAAIIMKHIIWLNCRRELVIQIIYCFAGIILTEATLCYLSFGISGDWISWGHMIYDGVGGKTVYQLNKGIYWQFIPPSLCVIILILGLNLFGEGLSKLFGEKETERI